MVQYVIEEQNSIEQQFKSNLTDFHEQRLCNGNDGEAGSDVSFLKENRAENSFSQLFRYKNYYKTVLR